MTRGDANPFGGGDLQCDPKTISNNSLPAGKLLFNLSEHVFNGSRGTKLAMVTRLIYKLLTLRTCQKWIGN